MNSVTESLLNNINRRFIFAEISFFERWWNEQDKIKQNQVRFLVENGRLEFVNGQWVMPDEAVTHYENLITNAELGLGFLKKVFGCVPKVAWQIDPFGHSIGYLKLLIEFGFDSLFLGRVDYAVFDEFKSDGKMEFYWKKSGSEKNTELLTIINSNLYNQPASFCWDTSCDAKREDNPFIQDNARISNFNVPERVSDFLKFIKKQYKGYSTDNFMVTFGGDFHYTNADQVFTNIDKLIEYTNDFQDEFHVVYSTPGCYVESIKKSMLLKQGRNLKQHQHLEQNQHTTNFSIVESTDFSRYSDSYDFATRDRSHWSGYYSSRPSIKKAVREASSVLRACGQFDAFNKTRGNISKNLRRAVALLQHHDAVTGTERSLVLEDYLQRLRTGVQACLDSFDDSGINNEKLFFNSLNWEITTQIKTSLNAYQTVKIPALSSYTPEYSFIASYDENSTFLENEEITAVFSQNNNQITIRHKISNKTDSFCFDFMVYKTLNTQCGAWDNSEQGPAQPSGAYILKPGWANQARNS